MLLRMPLSLILLPSHATLNMPLQQHGLGVEEKRGGGHGIGKAVHEHGAITLKTAVAHDLEGPCERLEEKAVGVDMRDVSNAVRGGVDGGEEECHGKKGGWIVLVVVSNVDHCQEVRDREEGAYLDGPAEYGDAEHDERDAHSVHGPIHWVAVRDPVPLNGTVHCCAGDFARLSLMGGFNP